MSAEKCDTSDHCIRPFADEVLIKECKHKLAAADDCFNRLSQILSLAGNNVRLRILYLLEEASGGLCVCDLSDILEMSIPAISQHLRKLKDGAIIQPRKVGQTIFYSIRSERLKVIKPLFEYFTIVDRKSITGENANCIKQVSHVTGKKAIG